MVQDSTQPTALPSTACLTDERWIRPLPVGERRPKALYCHILAKRLIGKSGGKVLSGWVVESSIARESWYCVLTHHSVAVRPNGVLVDPSYHGEAPLFLPDPSRPYDFDTHTGYNSVLIASESFLLLGEHYPANTPVWVRFDYGKIVDASLEDRHSRFRTTHGPDDVTAGLADLGFMTPTMRDALFCSTIRLTRQEPGGLPQKITSPEMREAVA